MLGRVGGGGLRIAWTLKLPWSIGRNPKLLLTNQIVEGTFGVHDLWLYPLFLVDQTDLAIRRFWCCINGKSNSHWSIIPTLRCLCWGCPFVMSNPIEARRSQVGINMFKCQRTRWWAFSNGRQKTSPSTQTGRAPNMGFCLPLVSGHVRQSQTRYH